MGHADAYCPASPFGKILQQWILRNLAKAKYLACVSQLTYRQLFELLPTTDLTNKHWTVIHNAFNADFSPMPSDERNTLLTQVGLNPATPYLLHVGSSLERKTGHYW